MVVSKEFCDQLAKVHDWTAHNNIRVNAAKSQLLVINSGENQTVNIAGQSISNAGNVKYLGFSEFQPSTCPRRVTFSSR